MNDRHALYVGWTLGIAMRHGIAARPVVDGNGDYTDLLLIEAPDGITITLAVPPPPDDWVLEP